eukprot:SAG31_NODE_3118_length_4656_cov_3.081413_4_plen_81_part_00
MPPFQGGVCVVGGGAEELEGNLDQAMMNKYGSHLTRRLVELCTEKQRTQLIQHVARDLVTISRSRFGTWTIQKVRWLASD